MLRTPAPGYAIAFLAFVAALMSVRDNSTLQKCLWLILLGLLLRVEFKAIKIDRDGAAREQGERFVAQQREFFGIVTKLDTSITTNDRKFSQAATKAQNILDSARDSEKLAGNALNEMTGAGSYPYVSPQTQVNNPAIVPLAIWNSGKNMLNNVAVTIRRSSDYGGDDIAFEMKPENIVGVIHNAWPRILRETISPHIDPGQKYDVYTLEIYTQNDLYSEFLQFEPSKTGQGWDSIYAVSHQMEKRRMLLDGKITNVIGQSTLCRSKNFPDDGSKASHTFLNQTPICGGR